VRAGALGLPDNVAVQVIAGSKAQGIAGVPSPAAKGGGALAATVEVAQGLSLSITPRDPRAVERSASRSRLLLTLAGLATTALAFALAAVLFARMRAAKRSSALRTDFVAAVSHELRTPIASVRMLAELLEEGRVEEGERREVFEALAREARRLGETVERLLGFSRMAAGRHAVERVASPVAETVAAAVDTFEERHPDLPRVERDLDPGAVARIDPGQIRLAVDNLLANARKYAPGGGPYRVTVAARKDAVSISVADHGPGIARRDQRRIFEPFERADDRLSRATEGSGIGLSLVRHVARAHGGEAFVESEPGRGATFTLRIPREER
jgi:signal transduction histidine kinase